MAPCPRWKQRPLATAAVCWVLVVALLTARPASAQGNGNGNNGNGNGNGGPTPGSPADLALRRAMWPYINNNCTMDMTTSPYRLMLDSVQNSTTNATTRFCFATAAGPAISNMSIADGGEGQLVDGAPACAVRLYANLFEIDLGIQPSCGANITNVTLNGLPWPYDIVYPPTFNVTTGMFANGTNLTSSARLAAFRLSKIRLAYQYASHLVVCMNVSAPCNRLPVLVNNSASRLQTSFVESGNKRCCPITEAPLPPPDVIPMPPSPPQPPAPPSPPQLTLAYSRSFVAVIYADYSQLALGDNNDATRMQDFMYDYRDAVAYALAITSDQVIITSISNGNTNPSTIVVGTTVAARSQQELNLLNVLLTFMALYPPRAFGTSFFAHYKVDHIVITIAPPSPSPPPTPPPNPFPPPSPSPSPPPAPPSPSPEPPSPPVPPPSPSPPVPPPSPDPSPPPSPPDFPSPPSPPSPIPPSPPSSPIPIVPTPVPVFTPAPTVAPVYPPTYSGSTPSGRRRILHAGARSKEDLRGMAQRHAWGVDVRNIRKQVKQRRA